MDLVSNEKFMEHECDRDSNSRWRPRDNPIETCEETERD